MIPTDSFRLTLLKIGFNGNSSTKLFTVERSISRGISTNGVEFFLVAKVECLDLDTLYHRFREGRHATP